MSEKRFLVVIPTRNRSELAAAAVKSVLDQKDCRAEIIVSDNSTDAHEAAKLSEFCSTLDVSRVRYIRPSEPLPMTEHWNWAMSEALRLSPASHIIYLTDRLFLKPFALKTLDEIVNLYPEKAITYSWDLINDLGSPVVSFQLVRTEKLYEVSSRDLLNLAAESFFNYSLPRMLNCCCPRTIIEAVREKYGYYFFSDNPDFNFAYMCLEIEDSILFYDCPLIISYGLGVSNGTSFQRGIFNKTETTKDFIKTAKFGGDTDPLLSKLPVSVARFIAYEYNLIKQISGSGKFKDLNKDKLLRKLLESVILYEDRREKGKALRQIFLINKLKFPAYLLRVYPAVYARRLRNKLTSKLKSSAAFDIIKHHRSLDEAIGEIIDNPRLPTSTRAFFESRIGRSPREVKKK